MKRVAVVTGTRERGIPRELLAAELGQFDLLIVGDCRGTDLSAFAYARDVLGLSVTAGTIRIHYADQHGHRMDRERFKRRNEAIAADAAKERDAGSEIVACAFPDKNSRGTWHCVRALHRHDIKAKVVRV